MKKNFTLFVLAFAIFMSLTNAYAQKNFSIVVNNDQKIQIDVNSNQISSVNVKTDKGYFSRLVMDQFFSSVLVGEPELPTMVQYLEIPLCDDISVTVIPGEYHTFSAEELGIDYPVFPAQPSYSKSYEGPIELIQNETLYSRNAFYTQPLATVTPKGVLRAVNLAELTYSPVQYNPVTQEFRIYESAQIEITFVNPKIAATHRMQSIHANPFFDAITSTTINHRQVNNRNEWNSAPIKMVIVSHSMFRGQLDEFAAWKRRKGFLVDVVYTDDPNVGSTTTSIKNYLMGLYTNATTENPAPTFVLLVGDVAQIPAYSGTTGTHPTDLYYFTWTTGDNFPDCYYGRFSATSEAQLKPQIDKTLMYEQYTMENTDYLNDAVLVAGTDSYWGPINANGQMNYLSGNYVNTAYGYANVHTHLYNCSSQAATIRAEIGAGVGYANYTAHCGVDGWADPSFSNSDVSNMNNVDKYGLIIGNCCLSNKFDETCFGETLLRAVNKGAVGYLGGSNSTYWNEDFYWSVGARTAASANPTYVANSLGAYDRLFHTHNEDHDTWMVTNGAINVAGNWAVQNSSSSADSKLYYWEIYHLMGDPSLMTYLTKPDDIPSSSLGVLMLGSNTCTINTVPYAYVAITHENTLIGTAFADASGEATLTFEPLSVPGVYEIAIWAQNYVQYFGEVNVIVPTGSYVLASQIGVTAETVPTNNARINIDCTLENVGVADATGVYVKLSSNTPAVTIVQDSLYVGNIPQTNELFFPGAFTAQIAPDIEDGQIAQVQFTVVSDNNTAVKMMSIPMKAPKLALVNTHIEESNGDNDGVIEAGETAIVTLTHQNVGHNHITFLTSILNSFYSDVTINTPSINIASLDAGSTCTSTFEVTLSDGIADGTVIALPHQISRGAYSASENIYISVGASSMVDFESGNFSSLPWQQGNKPWIVVNTNAYQGTYCAKSANNLSNSASSIMEITLTALADGNVSYQRKVSSENNYDFFKFYIDNQEKESLSGNINWGLASFPVSAGTHTYKFSYSKDYSSVSGSDCAWVDNITFPLFGTPIVNDIPQLSVINHVVSDVDLIDGIILPYNEDATLTFTIKNADLVAAQNINATLTVQPLSDIEGDVEINGGSSNMNTIASIQSNATANTSFTIKVLPSRNTEFRSIDFTLSLSYDGVIINYPISLVCEGTSASGICQHFEEVEITLSPNPVHNHLYINAQESLNAYELIDQNGKLVQAASINGTSASVDMSNVADGIYFLKVVTQNQKVTVKKVIKQ